MADGVSRACPGESSPADGGEAPLAERFARGEPGAFDQVVAAHQDRVTGLTYRLLGWSDEVEDVVQEVFLAALRGRRTFRGQSHLATWLTRITINACRRHRRRRWLGARLFVRRWETNGSACAAPADQGPMDRETFERVRQAVRALPARYREVVVLRYLEQMPVDEIGAVLGLSRSNVEVRLHRARNRLRGLLSEPKGATGS